VTRSAVAYWVNQFNTSQANLATRTSERDSARNALYVSGTYLSGPTWQAQDAVDLANYNAEVAAFNTSQANLAAETTLYNNEVAAYNAALSPASVDHLSGSGIPPGGDTWQTIVNLTADRTGQWVVIARMDEGSGGLYGGIELFIGGASQGRNENTFSGSPVFAGAPKMGTFWQGSVSAGTVFRLDMLRWGNSTFSGYLDAYFIPTQANPH
jgi:hypothetical protein